MLANTSVEAFADPAPDPPVRGFLHRPEHPNSDGLILTHGAGSNCQAPLLIALAEAFAGAGFAVLRCDLPYRQLRPYGPPGPGDASRDREGLKHAVEAMRKMARGRMFLGGHSYGGRQATMLCAEQPDLVNGLLLRLHTTTFFVGGGLRQGTHSRRDRNTWSISIVGACKDTFSLFA